MKAKYLFVSTHYLPDAHYGGVVESSSKLLKFLRRHAEFKLSTVSKSPEGVQRFLKEGDSCYRSFLFHGLAFSIKSFLGLYADVRDATVVFVNGIFTIPVTLAAFYAVLLRRPFVVAVRGGLRPWAVAQKRYKKHLYIKLITLPLLRRARYVLVTSADEEREIRSLGIARTIVIPNGVDMEDFAGLPPRMPYKDEWSGRFVFLFLGRMGEEKGVQNLVLAYRKVCRDVDPRRHLLVLAGPDHRGYLRGMELDYDNENIAYLPGVYGRDKIRLMRGADTGILPSYTENFGNFVVESLACEIPVITTTGTPWSEVEKIQCGLYVEPQVETIYKAMIDMYKKSPAERYDMGRRGREYVLESFRWEDRAIDLFKCLRQVGGVD